MLPGVRMECPECRLDCVMRSETEPPAMITMVVDGVPWCPNCKVPMRPVASVAPEAGRARTGITSAMTLEQVAAKCVEIEREAEALKRQVDDAKEKLAQERKAYEQKTTLLRLAVERLGRVLGGEQIEADLPLIALAEASPSVELCNVGKMFDDSPGEIYLCTLPRDHDSDHQAEGTDQLLTWPRAACGVPTTFMGEGIACTLPAGHEPPHRLIVDDEVKAEWGHPEQEPARQTPRRGRARVMEPSLADA